MTADIPDEIMREARGVVTAIAIQKPNAYEAKAEIVARALIAARRDQARKDAEIARVEALKVGLRERRTRTLGLRREPYPHEYGNEIADAIKASIGETDEPR